MNSEMMSHTPLHMLLETRGVTGQQVRYASLFSHMAMSLNSTELQARALRAL